MVGLDAIEARKLRIVEPKLDSAFDHVFTLSSHDSDLLEQIGVAGPHRPADAG